MEVSGALSVESTCRGFAILCALKPLESFLNDNGILSMIVGMHLDIRGADVHFVTPSLQPKKNMCVVQTFFFFFMVHPAPNTLHIHQHVFQSKFVIVVRLPISMEGKGPLQFSVLFRTAIPPQADGVVGTLHCLYQSGILITMVSYFYLKDVICQFYVVSFHVCRCVCVCTLPLFYIYTVHVYYVYNLIAGFFS